MYQSASVLNDDEFYNKNGIVTPNNREVTTLNVVLYVLPKTFEEIFESWFEPIHF